MNTDIRLSVGFWEHPKTVKLTRRLGLEGVRSLQILWLWATQNRPDGVLSGMDSEDIEIAAKWDGEPTALYRVLTELGFVDLVDETNGNMQSVNVLHGWVEHNDWQAESDLRSGVNRLRRLARSYPDVHKALLAAGCTSITAEEYQLVRRLYHGSTTVSTIVVQISTGRSTPLPSLPKPEEKNTKALAENYNRARECNVPQGECTDFCESPGIEFQELRALYDEHCRSEAPLAGFVEYKQLRASKRWPGIGKITDSILQHEKIDPVGWKQFAPGLGKFLREHWWEKKPTARASPYPLASPAPPAAKPENCTVALPGDPQALFRQRERAALEAHNPELAKRITTGDYP